MQTSVKLFYVLCTLYRSIVSGADIGSIELMPFLEHQKGISQVELQHHAQSWMRDMKYKADRKHANHNFSSQSNIIFEADAKVKSLSKLSGRMFFNHIAKCSGGSAVEQIKEVLLKSTNETTDFDDREECYGYTRLNRFGPGKANISHYLTMLRSPRHQVVSQFFMLKNFGEWCTLNPQESGKAPGARCCGNFPNVSSNLEALRLWLDWYASADWHPSHMNQSAPSKVGNYLGSCYTPWNMQSRALTCSRLRPSYTRALTWDDASPSLDVALKNLKTFSWVGVTELFDESLCLFEYQVTGVLPSKCVCAHKGKSDPSHAPLIHSTGGSSFENIRDAEFKAKVDKITRVDAQLYSAALARVVRELRALEKESGEQILCTGKLAHLKETTKYIPGLWDFDLKGENMLLKKQTSKPTSRKTEEPTPTAIVKKADIRSSPLRRLNGNMFLVHIAKCSGGSAGVQIAAAIKSWTMSRRPFGRDSFDLNEECYGYSKSTRKNVNHYLTMLRSPRTQVVSAFFMLKNYGGWCFLNPSEAGLKKGAKTKCCHNFPQGSDGEVLSSWLKFYADGNWSPAFIANSTAKHRGNFLGSCYTPWNMQSRALTCGGKRCHLGRGELFSSSSDGCSPSEAVAGQRDGWTGASSHRAHDWSEAVPSLDQALKQLETISWVGITELYDESMCVFNYRLTNKLLSTRSCTCDEDTSDLSVVASSISLSLTASSFQNHTMKNLRKTKLHASGGAAFKIRNGTQLSEWIDSITRVDAQLYRVAVARALKEIRLLEVKLRRPILCSPKLANLIEETKYIAGLWDIDLKHEVEALRNGVSQYRVKTAVPMALATRIHPQKQVYLAENALEYPETVVIDLMKEGKRRGSDILKLLSGKFFFTHIAKAAGGSAIKELKGIVKGHIVDHAYEPLLVGEEECYGYTRMHRSTKHGAPEEFDHYLTMLRSPRAQVVSQFFMLKDFGAWCTLDPDESGLQAGTRCCDNFPKLSDYRMLNAWVDWYSSSDWTPDHRNTSAAKVGNYYGSCYTPWNMHSRALTCDSASMARTHSNTNYHRATDWTGCNPPLETALRNLETFSWVGIAELFSESLCLFQYRAKGSLPKACVCDSKAYKTNGPWLPVPLVNGAKARHKTGAARYEDIQDHELNAKVDKMTLVDGQLYRAGVVRLIRELRALEGVTGSKLLCISALKKFKTKTDYIPGLWDIDLADEAEKAS